MREVRAARAPLPGHALPRRRQGPRPRPLGPRRAHDAGRSALRLGLNEDERAACEFLVRSTSTCRTWRSAATSRTTTCRRLLPDRRERRQPPAALRPDLRRHARGRPRRLEQLARQPAHRAVRARAASSSSGAASRPRTARARATRIRRASSRRRGRTARRRSRRFFEAMPDGYFVSTPEEMLGEPRRRSASDLEAREEAGEMPALATLRTALPGARLQRVHGLHPRPARPLRDALGRARGERHEHPRRAHRDQQRRRGARRVPHLERAASTDHDDERWERVEQTLRDVLAGKVDVEELVAARRGRRSCRGSGGRRRRTIDIDNQVSRDYTVLDVSTGDRVGLLFTITNCLYHLWLEIHLAKITTMVDQVLDVFYVTDSEGRKIEDPERLEIIRRELLGRWRCRSPSPRRRRPRASSAMPRRGGRKSEEPGSASPSPSDGVRGHGGARVRPGSHASTARPPGELDAAVDAYLDHAATETRAGAEDDRGLRARPRGASRASRSTRGARAPGSSPSRSCARTSSRWPSAGSSPRSQARALAARPRAPPLPRAARHARGAIRRGTCASGGRRPRCRDALGAGDDERAPRRSAGAGAARAPRPRAARAALRVRAPRVRGRRAARRAAQPRGRLRHGDGEGRQGARRAARPSTRARRSRPTSRASGPRLLARRGRARTSSSAAAGSPLTRQAVWKLVKRARARRRARRAGVARTRSGTPSRRTSSTAAPTCASCRRCSGTPTSRPRRSTRTSRRGACARSIASTIRARERRRVETRLTPPFALRARPGHGRWSVRRGSDDIAYRSPWSLVPILPRRSSCTRWRTGRWRTCWATRRPRRAGAAHAESASRTSTRRDHAAARAAAARACIAGTSPFVFGWAKPVPVDPRRLAQSAARHGPRRAGGPGDQPPPRGRERRRVLAALPERAEAGRASTRRLCAQMAHRVGRGSTCVLAVFNLLPIPPLDGGRRPHGAPAAVGSRVVRARRAVRVRRRAPHRA